MVLMLFSCARPLPLKGGDKDTTPPKIIKEESTPNFSTNFTERIIELEFDEWVNLKNPIQNIVISPPTEFLVKTEMKGKKLVVEFHEDEILKEDVTYQINFGEAIQDLTEGNTLKNHRFVFATGDKLDSLELKGKVIDAYTKKAQEKIEVYLYENLSDTVFQTTNPFYFTTTDEQGNFKFQNIRADSFQIFALKKSGINRYYSNPSEAIAFVDSLIILTDSSQHFIDLMTFVQDVNTKLVDYEHESTGLVKLMFNQEPRKTTVNIEKKIWEEKDLDTLKIWFEPTNKDSLKIDILNPDSSFYFKPIPLDTLGKFRILEKNISKNFPYDDTLKVKISRPILNIKKDSFELIDTVGDATIDTLYFEGRTLFLKGNFAPVSNYEIIIFPGAIQDIKGKTNDSINYNIKTTTENFFGNIQLSFENHDEASSYIIELLDKEEVIKRAVIEENIVIFNRVPSGDYRIRVIQDINNNGFWNSGELSEKLKPEPIFYFKLESLKQGWDLESTINLNN